jgi:phage terminase small subunit
VQKPAIFLPISDSEDLTPKERLFCEIFDRNHNATQAYIKAYECSWSHANSHAYEVVGKRGVKEYLALLRSRRMEAVNLQPEDIFERYMQIAFANLGDYVSFGRRNVAVMGPFGPIYEGKGANKKQFMRTVNYIDLNEMENVDTALISEISQGKDGVKIKLADHIKALEWLTEHMNMATEEQKARIAALNYKAQGTNTEGIEDLTPLADLLKVDDDE